MKADQIRNFSPAGVYPPDHNITELRMTEICMLQEIAAQIAELNEQLRSIIKGNQSLSIYDTGREGLTR